MVYAFPIHPFADATRMALAALTMLTTVVAIAHSAEVRPNVVMIVSDDQGWGDFGFMGHDTIRTPRLDRLASESAVFPNGYVPTSLCRASLASMLTGLHPHQHLICCNDPPKGVDRSAMHPFIRNAPALPRLLQAANYRSLQTGKFWEGSYLNAGFTDGDSSDNDRHIHAGRAAKQIGRDTMQPIYDFIEKSRGNPFFVWYAPMMPHRPHNPPPRFFRTYNQPDRDPHLARYYAMCEWFDETVGQLLDYLDQQRLTENTIVLFVVDNGWIQSSTTEALKSPFGGDRGKRSPYDGGIRTPILIRWPGHTKAGRYEDLVLSTDLAPTVLTAAGLPVPEVMTGRNLLDVAAGRTHLDRSAIFGEIYVHTATELGQPELDVTHRWVREGEWKLIVPIKEGSPELFHLARDPHEKEDLSAKEPKRVARLRELIARDVAARRQPAAKVPGDP